MTSNRDSARVWWPVAGSTPPAPKCRKVRPGRGLIFGRCAAARLRDDPKKVERLSRQAERELMIQLSRRDFARGHLTPEEWRVMSRESEFWSLESRVWSQEAGPTHQILEPRTDRDYWDRGRLARLSAKRAKAFAGINT